MLRYTYIASVVNLQTYIDQIYQIIEVTAAHFTFTLYVNIGLFIFQQLFAILAAFQIIYKWLRYSECHCT